jgi:hypothetical protein
VAVLEQLQEVRVTVGVEVEERDRGLPPRRNGDVEALVEHLVELLRAHVAGPRVRPLAPLRRLRPDEHDVHPVMERQLAGVLDHDPGAARQAEVREQEGDLHAAIYSRPR